MTRRERLLFLFLAGAVLGLLVGAVRTACALPETVNSSVVTLKLQDGQAPAADSDFFQDTYICSATADSSRNHGAADTLRVSGFGNTSTFKSRANRTLMKIDVRAALPDSAEIRRVRLFLYMNLGASGTSTDSLEVVRLRAPFNEGTGTNNGTVQAANADWNNRTGLAWASPGASAVMATTHYRYSWTATDSSSTSPTFDGQDSVSFGNSDNEWDITRPTGPVFMPKAGTVPARSGWAAIDITELCRGWQSGRFENNGFMIKPHNNGANKIWGFASSEHPYKKIRPYVLIEYIDLSTIGAGTVRLGIPARSLGLGGS